ncbi:MAG: hypothetical protein D6756_05260 [Cyanobacteria bacterium J083]|nr:MAG: hypothetical protein D6756_05260 [Cyanobacteria bacterium J083]
MKQKNQELRFKFYHELNALYLKFFDEIADDKISDAEAGRVAQALLRSRQEALKHLVSEEEMDEYLEVYPAD